jgi:enoyl-CoA hydratase/carnithine racemase
MAENEGSAAMDRLRLRFDGPVAHVQLWRPEKLNALDPQTLQQLVAAGELLRARQDCRVVVLSGTGRCFCSGLDLDTLRAATSAGGPTIDIGRAYRGAANIAQLAVLLWRELPMPVIVAIHGVAFGGGLQLALGADIRIVHPEARLSIMEVKWGLVPDMGGMALLRELVRPDVSAELVFSARTLDGAEALRLGLATRLADDPLAAALELAGEIAARSPDAVRAAKRLLTMRGSADDILRAEAAEQTALFGRPNQREAVAAGLTKRAPVFQD